MKTIMTIVPESATHVAFVNGDTYSREEVLRAVNNFDSLLQALKYVDADYVFRAMAVPIEVTEALAKAEGR